MCLSIVVFNHILLMKYAVNNIVHKLQVIRYYIFT
jgi:hypothetical protein